MQITSDFQSLWLHTSNPPDVFKFLSEHRSTDPQQYLLVLRLDQQYRWKTPTPLQVEDYLTALPDLPPGIDWKLQLAIGEFEARRDTDRPLSEAEIGSRFPGLSDTLRNYFQTAGPTAATSGSEHKEDGGLHLDAANKPIPSSAGRVPDPHLTLTYIVQAGISVEQRGRYRLDRILGEGNFGRVYLGYDEELQRQVAIKVPTKEHFECPEDAETYLAEARTVARLDHPHIVPVYDMGRTDDGSVYVVSRYVAGSTLEGLIKDARPPHRDSAVLVATLANALDHAHQKRLIHRDIKPANILIDDFTGTPFIADFGLAIREEDHLRHIGLAGTPAYMSPEQARGEGHRLDGRSDLFSLGVILYELLTGKRPFRGSSLEETLHLVINHTPQAPRELDDTIPPELERICLKSLSKRASERYATGAALAEDLREWLNPKAITTVRSHVQTITPRGLRSFTAEDADFFLDLLPGPRNRDGLPESIAFWKSRIEHRDPEQTFSVGLLYGPSGCGKSSLVKAGLIPNLDPTVIAIYIEATPEETELRLLRGMRRRLPDLPDDLHLTESLERIRRSEGHKVVLIIDQFEQWLYTHRVESGEVLPAALRQCDGGRLQAILMIRDDFYLAAARLMNEIDVPILTDQNFKLVDLFDADHAQNVLIRFGQAYSKLPENSQNLSSEQIDFIRQVVEGLSEEGKVVSVRLALLAEMLKSRDWGPATLETIGGLDGIGISFLEETFASSRADVRHRQHQEAVRRVLRALLPEAGTNIKGAMQSEEELLEASGYRSRPAAFKELLKILDGELRLVTPTDPEGSLKGEVRREKGEGKSEKLTNKASADASNFSLQTSYFQLTHDYLVPSLRDWLTRKQRETKKGRAELKLAERAAVWGANPENKQLPTLWEWLTIRRLTEKRKWRPAEQALMRRAGRYHTTRASLLALSGMTLLLTGLGLKRWNEVVQLERDATNLVSSIAGADYGKLPDWIELSNAMRPVVDPKLKTALEQHDLQSDERLKLSLALLPSDPEQLDYLVSRLLSAEASQVPLLVSRLQPHASQIVPQLWATAKQLDPQSLLQAASALAAYAPESEDWVSINAQVADQVVQENPLRLAVWIESLRPAAKWLKPELKGIYAATPPARSQTEIDLATDILESYAADDFQLLHELVLVGQPQQFKKLFPNYQRFSQQAIDALRAELARPYSPDNPEASETEQQRLRLAYVARQANAAVALLRLEDPTPVYEFLTVDRNPEALSQFIYRIRGREVSPLLLISSFQELQGQKMPDDPLRRQQHIYRLYGFILGLGEYTLEQLPAQQRDGLVTQLAEMYGSHPSRAVHSALGWLLRRWGQDELVRLVDETPLAYDESGVREWYVMKIDPPQGYYEKSIAQKITPDFLALAKQLKLGDLERFIESKLEPAPKFAKPPQSLVIDFTAPIYFTMIVFPGGELEMSDPGDKERVKVAGPIAVSDREVTWRQFSPIDGDTHRQNWNRQPSFRNAIGERQLQPDEPVFGVTWFEAVNYCRWLTSVAGMDETEQSYRQIEFPAGAEEEGPGFLELPVTTEWPLRLDRSGFRLLREAEWEYVARAGTETEYSFGDDQNLLGEYGWYQTNSKGWSHRTRLLRPSMGGLFDMHGNLFEWTDDWYTRGSNRLLRGGSWGNSAADCRTAIRNSVTPTNRATYNGFRLALVPSGSGEEEPAEPGAGDASGAEGDRRREE